MNIFITELRKASIILEAYRRGSRTVAAIAAATHLRVDEVGDWVTLLGLNIKGNQSFPSRWDGRELPTFSELNRQD